MADGDALYRESLGYCRDRKYMLDRLSKLLADRRKRIDALLAKLPVKETT